MTKLFYSILFVLTLGFSGGVWATAEDDIGNSLTSTFELLLQELPKFENTYDADAFIREHIVPLTDTRKSAQLMLGKDWRRTTKSQRNRFVKAMTDRLIITYSAFLLDDRVYNSKFEIVRTTVKETKTYTKYIVKSKVTVEQPIDVVFTIYQRTGKKWGIVDIKVEGISMALTWRKTFTNLIHNRADIEKVIVDLENGNIKKRKKDDTQ